MKRTELEKRERELKRAQKKQVVLERKMDGSARRNVGEYIEELFGCFRYDENEIFNTKDDLKILEVLENMKEDLPEKKWSDVIRKAVKKTNISSRDQAVDDLLDLMTA